VGEGLAVSGASPGLVSWLLLGPLAVRVQAPWLPFSLALHRSPHPAGARWCSSLVLREDPAAGHEGSLTAVAGGLVGPGFSLQGTERGGYEGRFNGEGGLLGAVAALLVAEGQRQPWLLLHAATLRWGGAAVAFLGASGVGKSTLARRHPGRALGSNAALVWEEAGQWWSVALPLTGHGDTAVRRLVLPLAGGFVLGARSRPAGQVGALVGWLSHVATAKKLPPRLDLVERLAAGVELRGGRGAQRR
jgi:hypothetical protein